MTALYAALGAVAIVALALWLAIRSALKQGAADERAVQSQTVVENIDEAKKARDDIGALSALERREWLSKWTRR